MQVVGMHRVGGVGAAPTHLNILCQTSFYAAVLPTAHHLSLALHCCYEYLNMPNIGNFQGRIGYFSHCLTYKDVEKTDFVCEAGCKVEAVRMDRHTGHKK